MRLAGSELTPKLYKGLIGPVETLRKDRGDVEGHCRIMGKQRCRVSDVEIRLLQGPHVRRMGLIPSAAQLAEQLEADATKSRPRCASACNSDPI